jgi:hypothetical protein
MRFTFTFAVKFVFENGLPEENTKKNEFVAPEAKGDLLVVPPITQRVSWLTMVSPFRKNAEARTDSTALVKSFLKRSLIIALLPSTFKGQTVTESWACAVTIPHVAKIENAKIIDFMSVSNISCAVSFNR